MQVCQICGEKPATTHIETITNGTLTEYHLCYECAQKNSYTNLFNSWNFNLNNFLTGFIQTATTAQKEENVKRCAVCGFSFEDITKKGKVGCAKCYDTFREQLSPLIKRIHGASAHTGKRPGGAALRVQEQNLQMQPVVESPIKKKKRELLSAIEVQNFELASILRDELKELTQDD